MGKKTAAKTEVPLTARNEEQAPYGGSSPFDGDDAIEEALALLNARLRHHGQEFHSPRDVANYLKLKMAELEHEEFHVLYLSASNALIKHEALFRGTITETPVFIREVAKQALLNNATAIIVAHNHPSGKPAPSRPDREMTSAMQKGLNLLNIPLLDHIIIGGTEHYSFDENRDSALLGRM